MRSRFRQVRMKVENDRGVEVTQVRFKVYAFRQRTQDLNPERCGWLWWNQMPLLRARIGRSRDDSRNQERHNSEKNKQCIPICSSRVCHRNLHGQRIDVRDYTARH